MNPESGEFYDIVLRIAALPALGFVIWLSWIITNRLMSPEWQRAKRNRQIRKAVAERQALMEELRAADEAAKTARGEKPTS